MARTLTGNNRRREQRLQEVMLERMTQQFERRLAREIARAMREAASGLDPDAIGPKHAQRLDRLLESVWRTSMQAMAEHMTGTQRSWRGKIETKNLDEVEPTEVTDRLMQSWMNTIGAQKITEITTTTQNSVRQIINRGIRDGLSEREIGKLIRDTAPTKSASRAQTIARTEVHAASQASAQSVAEASNLNMVRVWVSSKGERTRTIADGAQFDHLAADGQRVGMNERFVIRGVSGNEELRYPGDPAGSAANVINCFDGDVPVAFDSCKKSIRSVYSGEMITIKTASGYNLTGTPNHPVLTDRGMIPLSMVDHSSNLICCPMDRNLSDGLDVKNVPSTFQKVHDTLGVIGVRVGVGAVPVNLYGRSPDGEVDIVGAKRVLRNGIKPPGLKSRLKLCLKMADLGKVASLCKGLLDRAGLVKLWRSASHGLIGRSNLGRALSLVHAGPLESFGLALTPDADARVDKDSPDRSPATAKLVRDGLLADSGQVKADDFGLGEIGLSASGFDPERSEHLINVSGADAEFGGNFMAGLSRHVHLDSVVSIDVKRVREHSVYTIETNEGFYSAGGIISQNCRCSVVFELE